jgi:hypothetical protein
MRLRILAVIVAAATALVLAGCGGGPTPAASGDSAVVQGPAVPQNAIPDKCLAAPTGTMCSPGHMVFPLIDGHVWYSNGPLNGLDVVIKDNGNTTYTVTWSTTNPQMTIVGATDDGWRDNGTAEDVVFQSPYTTQPGQTSFALHIEAPGLSEWDQVKPTATS